MKRLGNLRSIKSERDHAAALREIEALMDAKPGTAEGDRLEALSILVAAYEDAHHAVDPPDPIEAIVFCMDQRRLTRADLAPYLGGRGRVSEVLNRRRPLTLAMIRRLHAGLGIPADVLVREYKVSA
jgi:HTH-type transcriptional regulator/antitoxin HigA